MPTFEPGAVVKIPFPYTNRDLSQARPALVVAGDEGHHILWVLMITSAEHRRWPGDVEILDAEGLAGAGLPHPSVIRTAKIATIEAGAATCLGLVGPDRLNAVRRHLAARLGL